MRRHVMTTDLTLISVWWYQSWNRKELTLKILKGLLEHRGEENCIMRSFMICIVLQVILQQCHAGRLSWKHCRRAGDSPMRLAKG